MDGRLSDIGMNVWRSLFVAIIACLTFAINGSDDARSEGRWAAWRACYVPRSSRIVFDAEMNGQYGVYIFDPVSHQTILISKDNSFFPAVSSDGKLVAYTSRGGDIKADDIYIAVLAQPGSRRPLTRTQNAEIAPSFSRDGKKLVFGRGERSYVSRWGEEKWTDWDVWVADVDGANERRITKEKYVRMNSLSIAPNGKTIIYGAESMGTIKSRIYTIDMEGGEVPHPIVSGSEPTYSPDGKCIAFISDRTREFAYEIWTANADGTDARQVTNMQSYLAAPAFAPNGKTIMFLRWGGGLTDVSKKEILEIDLSPGAVPHRVYPVELMP